jgi:hypothetical protein
MVALLPVFVIVIAGAVLLGGALAAAEHAQSGADAVAHAIAAVANTGDKRDDLSIQVQAGRWCQKGDNVSAEYKGADEALCNPLFAEADAIAQANGVRVTALAIGPDTRDMQRGIGPGRLVVMVAVQGNGPLVAVASLCGRDSQSGGLCHPQAVSAAELVW